MKYCEEYRIAGLPMLVPDQDVELQYSDLDASDAGRDESGWMHRIVVRRRVKAWAFTYSHLTAEEYAYMESLFQERDTFTFTFPTADGSVKTCKAYCSGGSIALRNLRTGIYKNYKFSIIEC